ncbi:hypothetical protein D9758_018474 [Tetrapyrgos nigripes]|uniref:Peptidase C14 caspase domain-containing protein n=1 Tax=Tetrapyrgos nigripes TaxID=182062 RepID=A0A8H5BGK9_9AGAR|nr:hypothetical protein D9758_018474 [Tetrapyrgos nigripes]
MKALIIGIDKYHDSNIHKLGSAVSDARRMKKLCMDYGMRSENAVELYNQAATRQAILDQISAFSMDQRIVIGDPILIYFAGHGTEVEVTRFGEGEDSTMTVIGLGWSTSGQSFKEPVIMPTPGIGGISTSRSTDLSDAPLRDKIQMLLPYDFIVDNGSQIDEEGQGILDFVLGESLAELASKKGNNITVILDSCHSGSGCRGYDEQDPSVRARGMTLNSLHKLHGQPRRPPDLNDYVLLAACAPEGLAYENRDGGYFTTEIVNRLQVGINISPSQLVQQMTVNGFRQQPQCEGVHSNRPLFSQTELSNLLAVVVESRDDNGQVLQCPRIILQSGEESGIFKGTEFKVYADLHLRDELGHFVVLEPGLGKSLLGPRRDHHMVKRAFLNGYAVRWRSNDLALYHSSFPDWFRDWAQIFNKNPSSPVEIHLQQTPLDHPPVPGVYVSSFDQEHGIGFEVTDYIGERDVFGRFYASFKNSSKLSHILYSMARFYWHLNRQSSAVESEILSYVKLECFKLRDKTLFSRVPEGPNLVRAVTNGPHSQLIDMVVDPDPKAAYGFKITNTSDEASFSCALFFFDLRKLAIIEFYHPVIVSKGRWDHPRGEAHIRPRDHLTIGYGTIGYGLTGRPPAIFTITDEAEIDLGYLLLYVSVSALNLKHISMGSPFDGTAYFETPIQSRGGGLAPSPEYWAVQKIPVVMRRNPAAY